MSTVLGRETGHTVRCAPCCEISFVPLSAGHCMQFQTIGTPGVGVVLPILGCGAALADGAKAKAPAVAVAAAMTPSDSFSGRPVTYARR